MMLSHWAFDSVAYRTLKPGPRALLWEFIRRYNGANNGRIAFSQRDMSAAIAVADRETVAGYVRQLEERCFIAAQKRGGFSVKAANRRATEWMLAMFPVSEEPATKDFMRWRPSEIDGTEKPACKDGKSVPKGSTYVCPRSNVTENPSVKLPNSSAAGTENPSTYTSIAIASAESENGKPSQGPCLSRLNPRGSAAPGMQATSR